MFKSISLCSNCRKIPYSDNTLGETYDSINSDIMAAFVYKGTTPIIEEKGCSDCKNKLASARADAESSFFSLF